MSCMRRHTAKGRLCHYVVGQTYMLSVDMLPLAICVHGQDTTQYHSCVKSTVGMSLATKRCGHTTAIVVCR